MSEEERREMEQRSAACERALVQASGLSEAEFGQALEPYFPRVPARIPVNDIRRLIPKYTFKVFQTIHWIHVRCETNVDKFPCYVMIRFPYAYDYEVSIEKSCDGSAIPVVEILRRYFEMTQIEKTIEREGVRISEAMKDLFNGFPHKPEGN